jgi:hypothetical protein
MTQAKSNILHALASMSAGILLGYIIVYVFMQYQFESFYYPSLVRDVELYVEVIELLDDGNQSAVKQRMIESLEKNISSLSGCLKSFCADGRNKRYKHIYEKSYKKLQDIKQSKQKNKTTKISTLKMLTPENLHKLQL